MRITSHVVFFIISILFFQHIETCQVKILLTAALAATHYEIRKEQYIESLVRLSALGYKDVYVVEALMKNGPTFLDNYSKNIFYSQKNNSSWIYPGANEGITMLDALNHFNFDPDDMIIKMTGRYYLITDSFFKLVQNNIEKYDVFVKPNLHTPGDIATACFAMRCRDLKEMLDSFDFNWVGTSYFSIELLVGRYIALKSNEGKLRVLYVDKLDVKANIYGGSHRPDISSDWIWIL
ncbi:MAG TPA: hypothetical protein VHO47_05725 [Candidatus Babeliales bacterium]|nr:hypothetical protein [Candidatus Babeliales bacterium]